MSRHPRCLSSRRRSRRSYSRHLGRNSTTGGRGGGGASALCRVAPAGVVIDTTSIALLFLFLLRIFRRRCGRLRDLRQPSLVPLEEFRIAEQVSRQLGWTAARLVSTRKGKGDRYQRAAVFKLRLAPEHKAPSAKHERRNIRATVGVQGKQFLQLCAVSPVTHKTRRCREKNKATIHTCHALAHTCLIHSTVEQTNTDHLRPPDHHVQHTKPLLDRQRRIMHTARPFTKQHGTTLVPHPSLRHWPSSFLATSRPSRCVRPADVPVVVVGKAPALLLSQERPDQG